MEEIFQDFMDNPPDVVVFNSCLWDVTRYGEYSVVDFETRVEKLYKYLEMVLLPSCLFFWVSTLPVLTNAHDSFLLPRVHYRGHSLRLDLLEANYFVQQLCYKYERDFLDLNFHCRDLTLLHQLADGIHWNGFANRKFSNYVVRYIADCFGMALNPMEPLLEYVPNAVIEIDTSFSTALNSPSHGRYQSNFLSPESSSDWGKIKFCNSKPNSHPSSITHHNYLDNSLDNSTSHTYRRKPADFPNSEHGKSGSQKRNADEEIASAKNIAINNIFASQDYRKQRTQINYADLFEDTSPSLRANRSTKRKRKFRNRLKDDRADHKLGNICSSDRGRELGIEKCISSTNKWRSFTDSDSSDSDSVTSRPVAKAISSRIRSERANSSDETNERESSPSNRSSRNPFFTKFI